MVFRLTRHCFFCAITFFVLFLPAVAAELDSGFGNDGRVAVELGVYGDRANAVIVQSDGKIVVGGSSSSSEDLDFLLFRLLADGSLDPEFNFDGTVITPAGSADDEILALALQSDGKIIAAGYSSNGTDRDFALVRYNSDGSLDASFGLDGIVVSPVGNSDDEITGIVLQADGAIVVTGTAVGTAGRVIVLGRYLADGTLDSGFADSGYSFTGVGDEAQAEDVVLLDDGRLVVSGSYSDAGSTGLMLVGFTGEGQLDESFGENGVAVPADQSDFTEGYKMVVRGDGSLLVAGSVGQEGKRDAALFQFSDDGTADTGFGDNGVLVTSVSAEDDVLYDVLVVGETIAATGFTTTSGSREFLYVTYENATVSGLDTSAAEDDDSLLQIADLQVEDSLETYQEEEESADLLVDVLTTQFGGEDDVATAMAEVEGSGVVVVGVSSQGETTSAVVSKYVGASTSLEIDSLSLGSPYIVTGQPYDVTRTTAVIPVELTFSDDVEVSQRGIVFSTLPNPTLNESDSGDSGDTAPVLSNAEPSGTITETTATLTVTTDVAANCRYTDSGSGVAYDDMEYAFATSGGTDHSQEVSGLEDNTEYIYFIRCKNVSTGDVNTTDTTISFTVDLSNTVVNRVLQGVGDFMVSTAYGADATTTDGTTTDSTQKNLFSLDDSFLEEGSTDEGSGSGDFQSKLENLKPGTFFYARAYAVVGGKATYGNQVGFRTGDSCFVATAAFGSIFHPYVKILRDFRDNFLLGNTLGRTLVTLYYRYSPPIADIIAADSGLRFAVRLLLLPVVGTAWLLMQLGLKGLLLIGVAGCVCRYALRSGYTYNGV